MKAILFARVSSREQEETGYSLPAQQKLLEEYAKKNGFQIAKRFSISESARGGSQRTTFNEMLGYVKKNSIKVIVCEKVDRLTRNLKDAVYVNEWINKDADRQVHFVKRLLKPLVYLRPKILFGAGGFFQHVFGHFPGLRLRKFAFLDEIFGEFLDVFFCHRRQTHANHKCLVDGFKHNKLLSVNLSRIAHNCFIIE